MSHTSEDSVVAIDAIYKPSEQRTRAHRSDMRRNYSCTVAEDAGYQGRNRFLRWWPKVLLVVTVAVIFMGWNHTVQFTTLLCLIAYVHGRWLPWQFTIGEDGLTLSFPFGRRLFLEKSALTVRMEVVGAVALVGRRRHFGYLLLDRLGYEPDGEGRLRRALSGFGYNLI